MSIGDNTTAAIEQAIIDDQEANGQPFDFKRDAKRVQQLARRIQQEVFGAMAAPRQWGQVE